VNPKNQSVQKLASKLRSCARAIVGYTTDDALFLDLRTVFPADDHLICRELQSSLELECSS